MFRVDPQARTRSPSAPAAFPKTKRIIPPPRFANAHAEAMRRVKEDAIRAESLARDQSTAPSPPASDAASSDSESDSDAEDDAHDTSFSAKPAYVSLFFGWFGATAKQAIPSDLQFDTTDKDTSKLPNRRCYPPEGVWKAQMAREKEAAAAPRPPHTSRQSFPPAPESIRHSSRRSYPPVPDTDAAPLKAPPTPPGNPQTRPAPPPPPPPRGKRLYKTTSLSRDEMKEQLFRERSERNRRIQEEQERHNANVDEPRKRDEGEGDAGPDAERQRAAAQRQRDKEEGLRRLRERDAQRERERELRQAEAQRQRDAEAERLRQQEAQRQRDAEAERQRQRAAEAQRKRQADAERARLAAEAERLRRQREFEAEQATQQERWRRLEEQMRNLRENLERSKAEREREERARRDDPRARAEDDAARARERAAEEAQRRAQRLRREESAFKRMAGRWDARERHRAPVPLKRTPTPTAPLTPRERYDVLWARLLSPPEPDARPFTFMTFPWPGGRTLAEIARFLLPAAGGREKHIIRQQLRRWHPDKFAAVAQGRVVEADRQRVLEGQIAVVQALNELLSRF